MAKVAIAEDFLIGENTPVLVRGADLHQTGGDFSDAGRPILLG